MSERDAIQRGENLSTLLDSIILVVSAAGDCQALPEEDFSGDDKDIIARFYGGEMIL